MPRQFNFQGYPSSRVRMPEFRTSYEEDEEQDPYDEIVQRYRSILSQEAPALSRFRDFSRSVPSRDEYSGGIKNKIGAALAGFASGLESPSRGIETAMKFRELPYERALSDWDLQRQLLGQEAEFESQDRQNRLKGVQTEFEALNESLERNRKNRETESLIGSRDWQNRERESRINKTNYEMENPELESLDTPSGVVFYDKRNPFSSMRNVPIRTNAQEQLGINKGNLDVARGNLGQRKFEFGKTQDLRERQFGQQSMDDLIRRGIDVFNMQNQTPSYINPTAEETVERRVFREALLDPDFSEDAKEFIDWETNTDYPTWRRDIDISKLSEKDRERLNTFREYIDTLTRQKLNRRR